MEAYALFVKAHDKLGPLAELEPETISQAMKYSDFELEKVLACENVVQNHSPFEQHHVFEKTALLFNDRVVDFVNYQELTPCELEWTFGVFRLLDPIFPFDNEVLCYCAVLLHEDGLLTTPPLMSKEVSVSGQTIQSFLEEINAKPDASLLSANTPIMNNIKEYYEARMNELLGEIKEI